jgi:hypothetical protein
MWRLLSGKCSWIIVLYCVELSWGRQLKVLPSTQTTAESIVCPLSCKGCSESPDYNATAKIILIGALLFSLGYDNEEPKIFVLCLVKAGQWKGMWEEDSSCPHFLLVTLIKRPITCGSHLSVQWAVSSPVISIQDFVAKAIRSGWCIQRPLWQQMSRSMQSEKIKGSLSVGPWIWFIRSLVDPDSC